VLDFVGDRGASGQPTAAIPAQHARDRTLAPNAGREKVARKRS
jgi:hypothetical protein